MKTGKAVWAALLMIFVMALSAAFVYADTDSAAPAPPSVPQASVSEEHAGLAKDAAKAFKSATGALDLQTEMPSNYDTTDIPLTTQKAYKPLIIPKGLAQIILIAAIAIFIVIIIMTFRGNMWSDSHARKITRKTEDGADTDAVATVMRMEKAQLEADDLAAQGRYAEAMHVLLLQSVNELRRRLAVSIAVSLTSREILNRIGLSPAGYDVFADIISRVEVSYFGSHQPGADEYAACRQSYDALTGILREGGAAA